MKLFTHFRSTASQRLRIALAFKQVDYDPLFVCLSENEHVAPEYATLNPQRMLPAVIEGPDILVQSLAILEYLEETHPDPPLMPPDALGRARVRALAQAVACDIQPLNTPRVTGYLRDAGTLDETGLELWRQHWIAEGFRGIEGLLAKGEETGIFCHGDAPTLADVCLVPEVDKAAAAGWDLSSYPTICRIAEACRTLPAFVDAAPDRQPDAVS